LNIEFRHAVSNFFPSTRFSVEGQGRAFGLGAQIASNHKILLTLCTLELDFDVTTLFAMFDEARNLICATKDLMEGDMGHKRRNNKKDSRSEAN
jgi:hypothetical protein